MKKLLIETLKFFLILMIIILLYLNLLCLQIWWEELKATSVMNVPQEPSESKFAKAHKYHRIFGSYKDEDGKWYFDRGGKKCKLFKYQED